MIDQRWNEKRQEITYRVSPPGTSRFLLFDASHLAALRDEINLALKGTDSEQPNR